MLMLSKRDTEAAGVETLPDYLDAVFTWSSDAIITKTLDGTVTGWNPAAERIFGYRAAEIIGTPITALFPDDRLDEEALILDALRRGQAIQQFQTERRHRNGRHVHILATIAPLRDAAGVVSGAVSIAQDVTQDVFNRNRLWEEQNLDRLTHLPNRRLFTDKMYKALGGSDLDEVPNALMLVNLDQFKEINEHLGEIYGDHLLSQVAQRILACTRHHADGGARDVVARFAADEFAILLPRLQRGPLLREIADQVLASLREPFTVDAHEIKITARIGVAVAPRDGITPEELRQHAEMAAREAGRRGGDCIQEFSEELRRAARRRQDLQTGLRHALELGQFEVHYQPVQSLADGSLSKCEALVRWRHPELGMVSPAEFIPLAEESGLIREIGNWVFRSAVAQACDWQRRLGRWIQVAVNLSPMQLRGGGEELAQWARLLERNAVPPGTIACEITEGVVLDLSPETTRQLGRLRAAGIELVLDDFGVGYSNYAMLRRLDFGTLKIDQSLMRECVADERMPSACRAMVAMAHSLGWKVVAEGIETEALRELAREVGCDFIQGWLVCRPGLPAVIEKMFTRSAD